MLKLFKYEGFKVIIAPEALLLKPFKMLYNRDRTKNKEKAEMELGFIYFFADPRSDYLFLTDEDARIEAIKEGEGFPDRWNPDKLLIDAIEFYKSFTPTAALLLEDTRYAVDKLRKLLREIDLTAVDKNDKPIYTINSVTSAIGLVPDLIEKLDKAEKALYKTAEDIGKMRGGGEKTIFEDNLDS